MIIQQGSAKHALQQFNEASLALETTWMELVYEPTEEMKEYISIIPKKKNYSGGVDKFISNFCICI